MRKILYFAAGFFSACFLAAAFCPAAHAQSSVQIRTQTSTGTPSAVVGCNQTAIYDASTSGSTQLVALTANQSIYVCGYSIIAGGTVNVKLVYGTGSNCATGATNMTPAWQLTAQAGIADGSPYYRGMKTAASNALCINASGATAVQAVVYYAKF